MTIDRFMHHNNRIYYPRLILVSNTLLVLTLIIMGVVLVQLPPGVLCGAGYALSVGAVLLLLPCAREWFSPSYLELSGNTARLKWNNWRVTGTVASVDLPVKKARRLVLNLTGVESLIDPVGPLFLLASLITYPVIKHFVLSWWAPLYVINQKQLEAVLDVSPERSLTVSFPTRIFGRRRMRRVVDTAAAGI
jgi:hypothetical protein